jgi:hypothetical protein
MAACLAGLATARPEAAPTPPPEELRTFPTAEDAAAALVRACGADARGDLAAMFGAKALALIETSDEGENRLMRKRFATSCEDRLRLVQGEGGAMTLVVGEQEWPFPIPIVPSGGGWRFDAAAGVQELLDRRIGRNELDAIASLRAWLVAQAEYAASDHDGDRVREYAQRLVSTAGLQDGLYWPVPEGSVEPLSPLGPLVLAADPDYVETREPGMPWQGYRMRILTRQGRNAPGGPHSYVLNGNMVAGCALIAWPAEHGRTGVMTFLVSHHGTIYQRDMGPTTDKVVERITSFDPGRGWQEVQP